MKTKTKAKTISIIQAIEDPNLFQPFFGDLTSWRRWMVVLRAIYGLPITTEFNRRIFRECTGGRDPRKLPKEGFSQALILTGRRSGKSRIAAAIAAYSAALAGLESKMAPGETGVIACVAPTKLQSRIVRGYIRALFDQQLLAAEIVKERSLDAFQLRSGTRLELLNSDYRSVRGFSLLGVVVDELCFLGLESSSKIKTQGRLVTSLMPSLATTGGKAIFISSPYSKSGYAYETFQRHFGKDSQDVLVVNAPSRMMNPTLKQSIVDKAMAEDLSAALSEYGGQWRDDVANFVPIELIENLVVKQRYENIPRAETRYSAFVDLSGGRNDASALAIGHRNDKKKIILDALDWHQSPHNPHEVIANMATRLHDFGVRRVTGDAYSAEWASRSFQDRGITYTKCDKTKSQLYADLLPILCAGDIELLDKPLLVKQLASLERRTRAGGKDIIDSPPKGHEDAANAVAGLASLCNQKRLLIGAIPGM